jgi:single-stranded-DNA-specific exonuclease
MKERFHRPVIAFASVSDEELKGSARSVSGLNIRDVLAAIDKDKPGLITKFGGHAMAAGLSIRPEVLVEFREALLNEVQKYLDVSQCEGEILTDGPLHLQELTIETAKLIQEAGPWGQSFPEPVFDNVFEIIDQRLVGKHHLKLTLIPEQGNETIDAIAFNVDVNIWPNHRVKNVHMAYKLDINHYQGRSKLQLLVQALNTVA